MTKKIPEPETTLATPEYDISDHTAALKARRLMAELKEYASSENWAKTNASLGLAGNISNTRRWRKILNMPRSRKDISGAWFDHKGNMMERPDPKKTAEVLVRILAATSPSGNGDSAQDRELYLGTMKFRRNEILRPGRLDEQLGGAYKALRVSFHALQRMIQRGYGLSKDGELRYRALLDCLASVWEDAYQRFEIETSFPAEYRVEQEGAVFVVKVDNASTEMDLVTMLPPKK